MAADCTQCLCRFLELLEQGTLPRVRFHDLRHTAATLLLSAPVNPKVVSEMLGHASVAITLDIYLHVLPDIQQDAALAMGSGRNEDRAKTPRSGGKGATPQAMGLSPIRPAIDLAQ
jgi:hypothetical protein